jgi:hypothetical protein
MTSSVLDCYLGKQPNICTTPSEHSINTKKRHDQLQHLTPQQIGYERHKHTPNMLVKVPGDGYCAIHSINYFLNKMGRTLLNVNDHQQWLHSQQINEILAKLDISWTMHENLIPTQQFRNWVVDINDHICLDLTNQHWQPIECSCARHTAIRPSFIQYTGEHYDHIGTYIEAHKDISNLYVDEKPVYVNCANDRLTDGKGQAADFNNIFRGYKNNIQLPLKKPLTITRHNDQPLYLAVAHNNVNDSPGLVHAAYTSIFQDMQIHATTLGLTIILPCIGTALFKNDIRCFKRHVAQLRCKYILTFLDRKHMEIYNQANICSHGGFIPCATGSALTNTKFSVTDDYDLIVFNNNRKNLIDKLNDLIDALVSSIPSKDRIVTKHNIKIFEISGAPGHFSKSNRVVSAYYEKGIPWEQNTEPIFI